MYQSFSFQIWLKFIVLTINRTNIREVINNTQQFWKEDTPGSENKKILNYLNIGVKIFLTYIACSTFMFLIKPLLVSGTTIYYYYTIPQIPFLVSYAIEFYVTLVTMSMVIACNLFVSVLIVIAAGQFSNLNCKIRTLELNKVKDPKSMSSCVQDIGMIIDYHNFLME